MLRSRARIAEMARRWLNEGRRQEHLLPRGLLLADARAFYHSISPPLIGEQRLFVRRSLRGARMRTMLLVATCSVIGMLAALSSLATIAARRAETSAEQRRADTEDLLDFMLGDMHERLDALGRLDLLDAVTERAMVVLSHGWQTDKPDDVLRQVRALREVGEIRFTRGDLASAQKVFGSANASLHLLSVRYPRLPAIYAELGKLDFWRGQVAVRKNHPDEAYAAWMAYLADAEQRAALEPAAPDAWLELSYANNCLGTHALQVDRLDEAVTRFNQSIALKERILSINPTNHKVSLELADTLSWLALAEQQQGNLRLTLATLKAERQAVFAGREVGPPTNLWRYRNALADLHVAKAEADLGFAAQAATDYSDATSIFSELVDEIPDNQGWQRDLAYALLQQGWLSYGMNDPRLALHKLSEAEAILRRLLADDPKVADWHILLALDHNYQSVVLLGQGETTKASRLIVAAWKDMPSQRNAKATVSTQVMKAILDVTSGEAAAARGDQAAMTAYLSDVINNLEPRVLTSYDPRLLDPYVRAFIFMGHRNDAIVYLQRLNRSGYQLPMFESYLKTSQSRH
jgi:tetratricopeptide (TPR) repeat protein